MRAAASRGADELDDIRGSYEERLVALRVELEQQEVDKAALLDVVQVPMLPHFMSSCLPILSYMPASLSTCLSRCKSLCLISMFTQLCQFKGSMIEVDVCHWLTCLIVYMFVWV